MNMMTAVKNHDIWLKNEKKMGEKLEIDEEVISNEIIDHLDLSMAAMTGTKFHDSKIEHVDLSYSNFSSSIFEGSTLVQVENVKSVWEYLEYQNSTISSSNFLGQTCTKINS